MLFFKLVDFLASKPELESKALAFANQVVKEISPATLHENEDYQNLQGKEILLELTDSEASYALAFKDGINIIPGKEANPALTIKSNSSALSQLFAQETDLDNLTKSEQLTIKGEQQLLLSLVNLSGRLDYSAQNILSKYVGDVPAYFIDQVGKKVFEVGNAFKNFLAGIGNNPPGSDPFVGHSAETQAKRAQEGKTLDGSEANSGEIKSPLDLLPKVLPKSLPKPPSSFEEVKEAGETFLNMANSFFKAIK